MISLSIIRDKTKSSSLDNMMSFEIARDMSEALPEIVQDYFFSNSLFFQQIFMNLERCLIEVRG
jgi:hypothetical protein